MTVSDFIARYFPQAQVLGQGHYKALCPCHADKSPSLDIKEGDRGRILVKCFACGATGDAVCRALGMEMGELMGEDKYVKKEPKFKVVAEYNYVDEVGKIVFVVRRRVEVATGAKKFLQMVPDGHDEQGRPKWIFGVTEELKKRGLEKPVFRLPQVLAASKAGKLIFCPEGEKDVLALERNGFVATTSAGGAGDGDSKWRDAYSEYFVGCKAVVILPDNDPPPPDSESAGWQGQKFAVIKRDKLRAGGIKAVVVELPPEVNGKPVKDAADFFEAGGTAEELKKLVGKALAPNAAEWVPPWERGDAPVIPQAEKKSKTRAKAEGEAEYKKRDFNDKTVPPYLRVEWFLEWLQKRLSGWRKERGGEEDDRTKEVTIKWAIERILLWDGGVSDSTKNEMINRIVVFWISEVEGNLYYRSDLKDFSSQMFFSRKGKYLVFMKSDWFRSWLARQTGINREDKRYKRVQNAVEDAALHGENAMGVMPEYYFARRGQALYISCGEGKVCRVTAQKIEMVDNGTDGVLFGVDKILAPWELVDNPLDPFTRCELWKNMETTDREKMLFKLWALSIFANHPSKPPLACIGGVGSGKTTAVRGLFTLFGMAERNLGVDGESNKGEDNFWVSVNEGGLVVLDNVDSHIKWLADTLASASTRGSREKKRLYTDSEVMRLQARAWVAVTSAKPRFAADAGLSDRVLFVSLDRIRGKETKESALLDEIEKFRNRGLTFIVQALQKAMADSAPVPSGINRRHPDFAAFAVRIGRAIGQENAAIEALRASEISKSIFNLKQDSLGELLVQFIKGECMYTSTAILDKIKEVFGESFVNQKRWNVIRIGRAIETIFPHLEAIYNAETRISRGIKQYFFTPTEEMLRLLGHNPDEAADSPAPLEEKEDDAQYPYDDGGDRPDEYWN